MTLTVRYHAHNDTSGYGRAANGYIRALEEFTDVELDILPVENPGEDANEVDVAIYHTTPGRLATLKRLPARRHVALTTWETSPMPAEHVVALDAFDAVIVPSHFCKSLIENSEGTIAKVHVVPHAFDPEIWTPAEAPTPPDDVFTFYSIGAWGERKNNLGLLKAYLHAFTKADRTRLVLIIDKVNIQAISSVLARSGIPREQLPGLVVPDQRISDEEILRLHQESNCFVSATRAEGFGLPIFEAAIMGKPIISTRWGGQHEFLEGYPNFKDVWHFLTPAFAGEDDVKIIGNAMHVSTTMARGVDCKQMWAEPSLDRLSFLMRMVRDDHREGRVRDRHDRRDWYEKNYSLEAIGARLANTLKEIAR